MSEKPELLYDDLHMGKEFEPFYFSVDEKTIDGFLKAIELDENSIYYNITAAKKLGYDRLLAPHSLATLYARSSYLQHHTMPGGGILAKQEFQFLGPVFVGDKLVCSARVADKFLKKNRKYVVFEINTCNQSNQKISFVRIEVIWPK